MTYDIKCYQLAEAFLSEKMEGKAAATPKDMDILAQRIQQAVEDFIEYELAEEEKP